MLKSAATSPSHIASKYGKLLTGLWFQGQLTPEPTYDFPQSRDFTQNPSLNPIGLQGFTPTPAIDSAHSQVQFQDDYLNPADVHFIESTDAPECPDPFLSSLSFLRGGFPDLDNHGVGQLLMDL
jgi:hypothetical protein